MAVSPSLTDMSFSSDRVIRSEENWSAGQREEVFVRRVEDLVSFWCSDATGQGCMDSGAQRGITESFGSIETLEVYIRAYTDWNLFDTLWNRDNQPKHVNLLEVMDELLAFPYRMGMDPADSETVAWAKFFVPYRAGGTYEYRERLNWKGVKKLWKAGVPLEYAKMLDTTKWSQQMPVRRVIAMYRAGIPAEYARELLYGGRA